MGTREPQALPFYRGCLKENRSFEHLFSWPLDLCNLWSSSNRRTDLFRWGLVEIVEMKSYFGVESNVLFIYYEAYTK